MLLHNKRILCLGDGADINAAKAVYAAQGATIVTPPLWSPGTDKRVYATTIGEFYESLDGAVVGEGSPFKNALDLVHSNQNGKPIPLQFTPNHPVFALQQELNNNGFLRRAPENFLSALRGCSEDDILNNYDIQLQRYEGCKKASINTTSEDYQFTAFGESKADFNTILATINGVGLASIGVMLSASCPDQKVLQQAYKLNHAYGHMGLIVKSGGGGQGPMEQLGLGFKAGRQAKAEASPEKGLIGLSLGYSTNCFAKIEDSQLEAKKQLYDFLVASKSVHHRILDIGHSTICLNSLVGGNGTIQELLTLGLLDDTPIFLLDCDNRNHWDTTYKLIRNDPTLNTSNFIKLPDIGQDYQDILKDLLANHKHETTAPGLTAPQTELLNILQLEQQQSSAMAYA